MISPVFLLISTISLRTREGTHQKTVTLNKLFAQIWLALGILIRSTW
jgi:hypothetical protein